MAQITSDQFDELKQAPRGKWSDCIQRLLRSKDGEVVDQPIPAEDDNTYARQMARKAIYSLARHHGLKVSILRVGKQFHVKRLGKIEATQ